MDDWRRFDLYAGWLRNLGFPEHLSTDVPDKPQRSPLPIIHANLWHALTAHASTKGLLSHLRVLRWSPRLAPPAYTRLLVAPNMAKLRLDVIYGAPWMFGIPSSELEKEASAYVFAVLKMLGGPHLRTLGLELPVRSIHTAEIARAVLSATIASCENLEALGLGLDIMPSACYRCVVSGARVRIGVLELAPVSLTTVHNASVRSSLLPGRVYHVGVGHSSAVTEWAHTDRGGQTNAGRSSNSAACGRWVKLLLASIRRITAIRTHLRRRSARYYRGCASYSSAWTGVH